MKNNYIFYIMALTMSISLNAVIGEGDITGGTDTRGTTYPHLQSFGRKGEASRIVKEKIYNHFTALNNANGLHIYTKHGVQQQGDQIAQFDNAEIALTPGTALPGGPASVLTVTYTGSDPKQVLQEIEEFINTLKQDGIQLNYESDHPLSNAIGWFYNPVAEHKKIQVLLPE